MSGHVDVDGSVIVVAPVAVIALGNGTDHVGVTDTVGDQGSMSVVSMATTRSSNSVPRSWWPCRRPTAPHRDVLRN